MNRRGFFRKSGKILTAAAGLGALEGCARAAREVQPARAKTGRIQPNVVLLFADDLGYGDLGVQGGTEIPTPHIDSIANNGVRCTDGYVSCPVCSPTRAGMLTGRYQQRFGHEFNGGPANRAEPGFGLPLTEVTMADRMRAAGYVTGMFGKWHLGYTPAHHPQERGFDEFYGFLGGAHSYFDASSETGDPVLRGRAPAEPFEYSTFAFAREACAFIERHADEPFFLYLPFNAVHNPMHALPEYLDRFRHIADETRRTYAAMLSAMDDAVGMVLAQLRGERLLEHTLIFFISDNGGPTAQTTSRNDPLRSVKGQVYEGGIRVPFFVRWDGHLPSGSVFQSPVIALDVLPTSLAAAGMPIDAAWKLDGVDLMPLLRGRAAGRPHETLYWRFGGQRAVRRGDWKLVHTGQSSGWELYDLASDIGEERNRGAERPELVRELSGLWDAWNSELEPPRWGSPGRQRATMRGA